MGVQGLWELLAPVGRRVSLEAIANKRVAVDASIWIIQLMKAMRDERGEMIRNAHLLGFFRRICKLLFLKIKPVFVFDGGTPALKRRTVIARRRQRENAQAKIRKTAEKLLLNHLRTRKIEELAGNLENMKEKGPVRKRKGKVNGEQTGPTSTKVDAAGPAEAAQVPIVLQPEPPAVKENSNVQNNMDLGGVGAPQSTAAIANQEQSDALLAASLAAEWEDEELVENVQPFQKSREGTVHGGAGGGQEEEDDDDDNHEVMLMPGEGSSALDPAVLASLPASVQLELMVQMREQMVAENREKFQKVAKAPSQFSSLQIEAYLKTVAMRREITNVQKASAGLGVGGVQSTRIASESNKEFIFSSNFNAPTKALTAPLEQQEPSPLANLSLQTPPNEPLVHSSILLQSENSARTKLSSGERSNEEGERREMEKSPALPSVQTYVDEKGKTRVSRVRGMGVRMTRDLQWNLYLMKDREDSGKAAKFQEGNASDGVRGNTGEALAIAVNVEGGDMDEDEDLFMALVKSTPEEDGEKVEGNMKASEGLGADDDDDDVEWEDGVGDSMNGMLEGVAESGELAANGVKGASIDSSAVEEDVVWEDGSEQEGKKVPVELPKPTDEGERSEQGSPLDSLVRQSQGNSSANAFVEIAGPSSGPSSSTGPQKAQYYPAASLFKVVPNTQYGLEELSGSTSSVLTEVVGGKNGVLEGSIDKTAGRRMEQLKSHLEDESNLRKANRLSLLGGEMYKVAGQLETSNMGELRPSQVETKDDGDLEEAIRLSLEEQGKQTALYGDSDSLPGSPAGGRCLAEIKENSNSPISIPAVESAQPFGPWEGESYGGGDGFRLSEKTSVAEPYCNDGQKLNRVFKDPQIGEDGQTYLEGLSEEELIQLAIQRSLVEAVPAKQLTIREPTLVDVKWGEMCGEAKEKAQAEMGGKEAGDFESRERARKGKRIVEDKIDELDGTDGACIALTENAEGAAIENLIGVGASVEANTIEIGQREGQRRGLPTLSGPGGHAADSNESQKKEGGEAEGTEAGEFHPSSEGRDRAQRLVGDANQSASSSGANGGRSEQRSGWPLRHDAIPPIDEEELLQEAMAIDLAAERAELEERETKLAAEREALRHEEAELQAELEEERNELQFQNEQLMREVEEERVLLREEAAQLSSAQRKNARDAESVTAEMFEECQDLLQIFGIPYIIAPMEAEAQCAFMDQTKMVDAVVTDDCDVFLFGGRNVFKNIFDDRKYVETYLMKDVETELGLTREKLINMALLLGSDYTEGVSGIGIVNAIEVVNAYEGLSGLLKFKQWALSLDETLLNKVEASSRGRGRKGRGRGNRGRAKGEGVARAEGGEGQERDATVDNESEAEQNEKEVQQRVFQSRHRGVSKNWNIPDSFPSEAVVCAYLRPQVDDSSDKFTWGRPDLDSLRLFCRDKLSFSREKADEMLLPVMKAFESHETQLRLEAFYSFNQRFAKIRSKRIQKAVTGITGKRNAELTDLPAQFMAPRKLPATKRGRKSSAEVGAAVESGLEQEGANAARGRKRKGVNLEAGEGKGSRSKERTTDGDVQTSTMAKRGGRRGRGRGGGRGVGGRTGAGEASRGEGESAEEAVVAEVRRSKRQRKSIRYVDPNCEEEAASDGDSCSKDYEPSDDEEGEAVLRDMQAGGSNNLESTNPSFSKRCGEGGATFESSQMPRNRGEPVQCDLSERNLTGSGGYLFSGGGFCLEEEDNPEVEANPVGGGGRHHADSGGEDGDCLDGDSRALDNALSRSSELYKDMVGVKGVAGEETIASSLQRTGLSDLQETEDERQREEGKSLGFMPAERVVAEGVSGEGNESGTGRLRAAPSMKRRKKAAPDAI